MALPKETKPEVMRNFINLCVESSAALAKSGAYDKASERAGIALKYDPANTDAMMNMALFSVNMGNSRKASALWHQVNGALAPLMVPCTVVVEATGALQAHTMFKHLIEGVQ